MAHIVLADDGIPFDGTTPEQGPLGGAEGAVVNLAEALVRQGHRVDVYTRTDATVTHKGVVWHPLSAGLPETCDLYIANRSNHLIGGVPQARVQAFWTHNPCRYMMKPRYLWPLWRVRPAIIFTGAYHAATYPAWAPGGRRVIIPLGLDQAFLTGDPATAPPPPRAIFTSNPQRGLEWLLKLWARRIQPAVPGAELHLFSGPAVYRGLPADKAKRMTAILDRAKALAGAGVVLRSPVGREALVSELRAARVMLYRGDVSETFCLAVGEAQAMGVPAVVTPLGSLPERVVDGQTGYVCADDDAFVDRAVALLTDDGLWMRQHECALDQQRRWGWAEAATAFAQLLPEE